MASDAQTFSPKSGRTYRKFAAVWQAVRYETGYSAQKLSLPRTAQTYEDAYYTLGRRDAAEDQTQAQEWRSPPPKKPQEPQPRMTWAAKVLAALPVIFVIGALLFAMTSDFKGMV